MPVRKCLIATSLFLLIAITAFFPIAGESQSRIFPYAYQVKELANGLRVIVVPTDYPNIVALQIPVSVGSRNEVEPGKSGFAHFFEHMMFRGTPSYSTEEYNTILKNAGADQNAYTTDDYTVYHTTFSKEDLETVLMLEADRFQNLKYSEEDFKTESRAVLGEYNKNAANPFSKLLETQRQAAFSRHTYSHTTMGFIQDIEDMPNQYPYSLQFFDRYYRPEYTSIIISGDVQPDSAFAMVEKYWGQWKRGSYSAEVPAEQRLGGPISRHVDWDGPTLPWVTVAFRGPAFSDTANDMACLDLMQSYAFSQGSDLFQKLVVKEQKVDQFFPYFPDRKDPYLVTVAARVKNPADVWTVRDEIVKEFANLRQLPISPRRLAEIKGNLKYSFANSMDNSEAIASALVGYVANTRDPESINRVYRLYDAIGPNDIIAAANRYFVDQGMVVVTLSSEALPGEGAEMPSINTLAAPGDTTSAPLQAVLQKTSSPVINYRILFNVGAAADPPGKEGLATLTAAMISGGGSQDLDVEAIQRALFPMAAFFASQVDKEMTVFAGTTHRDTAQAFQDIILGQLLRPAWDEADFMRIQSNLVNAVRVNLRENNEEELGKEVLYEMIYRGHPYGHLNEGHLASLEKLTLADVRDFYSSHYNQANLVLGLAGDYGDETLSGLQRELKKLPQGGASRQTIPPAPSFSGYDVEIIEKDTRSTAISFGFPIEVNRAHPDFPALWLVRSYFGEHRSSNSHLYQRIRETRGMNYGDYAYIEYFPRGMFQFHPDPNLARQQQIFQVWIRPVVPESGHFALRTAMYELSRLVREGMTEEDFEATRNYLLKFANILTKTQDRQLGYALDSQYYGTGEFTQFIATGLRKLTLDDVNRVIRMHLQDKNVKFAIITKDAEGFRDKLITNAPSPIRYDAPKPDDLMAEDKVIEVLQLDFKPERVKVRKVEEVFQ